MDTSSVIVSYSEQDFTDATRALLPKGKYWQETENAELTNVIEAIGTDFKATHDDIELSLLTEFEEGLFGWKIRDYQGLLAATGSTGTVYDDINSPNLIKIDLFSYDNDKSIEAFEEKRLPHTEFHWIYPLEAETTFVQSTALTIKPEFSSQLELEAEAPIKFQIAIAWQLDIGDSE